MPSAPRHLALLLPLALLGASGCGDDDDNPTTMNVTLPFEARVGNAPYACGQTYTGLGTTGTTYEPMDFRVYVHDVRLVTDAGREVAVALDDDGVWQHEGSVLLDFANKDGLCTNGTAGTNARVTGTVPTGTYKGIRFKVGLPETLNHRDVSTAPAPFNDTGLFWSWRSGYLFTRIEGRTTGLQEGHVMHLGSTDCAPPAEGQTSGTAGCTYNNRPEIALDGFDPKTNKVVLDLASLLAGSNLDVNASVPNTAIGCMSQQNDPDCGPVFSRLGLTFGNQAGNPAAQAFARVE